MRLICFRFILVFILMFPVFLLSGCFSTLQTAKTTNGFSFTGGLYAYTTKKHSHLESFYEDYYFLVLIPRYGREATEKRIGLEGGIRLLTDLIDPSPSDKAILIMAEEFKLQIPRNKHLDLALGVDFYLIYPGSIFILGSKDLSKTFTLYGGCELFGGLYNVTLGERKTGFYPKLTLGSQINFYRNLSALVEVEQWFNTGWDSRENTRFAIGIKVSPSR